MAKNWRPVGELPIAFLDTETTHLDSSMGEVIEIAIIREYAHGVVDEWSTKIRPQHLDRADKKALEINGYAAHPEDWEDAPTFDQVAEQIAQRLSDCIVVGHNVSFDLDFVQSELKRAGVKARISYHKVDTVSLAYEHLVACGLEALSLDRIREFLGWSKDNAHSALKDTRDARRLYHLLVGAGHRRHLWWRALAAYRKMTRRSIP